MSARAFGILAVLLVSSSSVAAAQDPADSLVHVSGRGLVRVAPDQVVVELTATTTDDDLIRVRETSDKDARAILAVAKGNGVEANGFEVSRLELSLDYNEQLRRRIYQVERDLTLRLNDLTKLDALLADLLSEPNLKVVGISFVTSKARQHEFEARRRAVADAREKAAHLAELNGFKLGDAREIHVVRESQRPFVTSIIPTVGSAPSRGPRDSELLFGKVDKGATADQGLRFVAFQPDKDAVESGGSEFALGTIEITADVDIDFALAK